MLYFWKQTGGKYTNVVKYRCSPLYFNCCAVSNIYSSLSQNFATIQQSSEIIFFHLNPNFENVGDCSPNSPRTVGNAPARLKA